MKQHKIVSRDEWIAARKAHLAKEKEFTARATVKRRASRAALGQGGQELRLRHADGKKTLADLFDGQSQLIVYHFMLGPGWEEGCPSCSFLADHFDGARHPSRPARRRPSSWFRARRSPEIETFKRRMGWRFQWVSSFGSDFNFDYHVSFPAEQVGGRRRLQL